MKACYVTIAYGPLHIRLATNLFKTIVDNDYKDVLIVGEPWELEYKEKQPIFITGKRYTGLIDKLDLILHAMDLTEGDYDYYIFLDADCVVYDRFNFMPIIGLNPIATLLSEDVMATSHIKWDYPKREDLEETVKYFNLSEYRHINGGLFILNNLHKEIIRVSWWNIKKYFLKNNLGRTDEEPMAILIQKLKCDYSAQDDYITQDEFIVDSHCEIHNAKKPEVIIRRTYYSDKVHEEIPRASIIHFIQKNSILNHVEEHKAEVNIWENKESGFNLAVYGSHNAAIAISYEKEILEVIELERWSNQKNAAFYYHFPVVDAISSTKAIKTYLEQKYEVSHYDTCMHNACQTNIYVFPANNYIHGGHHHAHAYNSVYQSEANNALIVSFDGGSEEGFFNIFLSEDRNLTHLERKQTDLCVSYQTPAHYLSPIQQADNLWWGNLTYAGKIMGLAAYGSRDEAAVKCMMNFYRSQIDDDIGAGHSRFLEAFGVLGSHRFSEQESFNIAAANQTVFETILEEFIQPWIDKYPNHQLQFSGGGGMNIINNAKWDAFVSPNPDDRGIALGLLLGHVKPDDILDSTYLGALPYDSFPETEDYSVDEIINDFVAEKTIGLIQGRSEHGARALGNRSILCLPKKGMKDKLNRNVKNREAYRPFGPVCRKEDADEYFIMGSYTSHMSHNARVKDINREDIASIIHADGTARLQTVTNEQNPFLYEILTRMKERNITPVLINTSFNVRGMPMVNRYTDAIWVRDNTGLDLIITGKQKVK